MGQKNFTYFHRMIFLVVDFLIVNSSFLLAYSVYPMAKSSLLTNPGLQLFLFFNISWLISGAAMRLYSTQVFASVENVYRQSAKTLLLQALFFAMLVWFLKTGMNEKAFFILCYGVLSLLFGISRFFFTYISEFIVQSKVHKKIAIVGYNDTGVELAKYFQGNNTVYTFKGFFDNSEMKAAKQGKIVGGIDECVQYAIDNDIKEIYSTLLPENNIEVIKLIEYADLNCVRVKFVPDAKTINLDNNYKVQYLGDIPVGILQLEPLQEFRNRVKKRIFDILFSGLVIIFVLSWLVPLIGLLIKLNSKGPVFFKQNRTGRDNEIFKIFKFRTMTVTEADQEYKQATKNDSRITTIGKFLRKTSLDEMPQFLNVFLGDMSITGPRPHPIKLNQMYMSTITSYMVRHYVKPGISGWAQVHGLRGETETPELMKRRIDHDIWYVENWSTMLDIKIIVMTIINFIRGEEKAY